MRCEDLARRVERLAERGVLQSSADLPPPPTIVVRRPGALDRFFQDRDA